MVGHCPNFPRLEAGLQHLEMETTNNTCEISKAKKGETTKIALEQKTNIPMGICSTVAGELPYEAQ